MDFSGADTSVALVDHRTTIPQTHILSLCHYTNWAIPNLQRCLLLHFPSFHRQNLAPCSRQFHFRIQ